MRIFITGSTGYIGQRLLSRLINDGHEVHALCRQRPDHPLFNNPRVKVFEGELLHKPSLATAMAGCEQVYHVAGYARVWAKDPEAYFRVNVEGTLNVLEAARHAGAQKVVFTSTGGTYGISNGSPIHESMIRTIDFFTEYESSKFMAEERVQQYVRKGMNVVIVNPVRVYGPGLFNESNALSFLLRAYLSGRWHVIPGTGKAIGSFSYIDDVVDGHVRAMAFGTPGEKYILGGENADFNKFFSIIREQTKKNFLLVKVPLPLMMLFGWKEELMAKWFGVKPAITRKWIRKYNYDMACSSDKAIQEIGYRITPLAEGIARTISWLEEQHYVQ